MSSLYSHAYLPGRVNFGAGRHVPRQHKDGIKIHRSVRIRMKADHLTDGKYKPKAELDPKVEPEWID
jgi:hypothetical protein